MELQDTLDKKTIDFFKQKGWIDEDEEVIAFEKAGDGNMNFVRRLKTNKRSIIIKQSMAYVYKYPQIAAPIDRIFMEKAYYDVLNTDEFLKKMSTEVIAFNKDNHLILLKDLGNCKSFDEIYSNNEIQIQDLHVFVSYLKHLHKMKVEKYPNNISMRNLNHEHIFEIPFDSDNEIDYEAIQNGLSDLAKKIQSDSDLKKEIKIIGKKYLDYGDTLIHGDFYPGSFLKKESNYYVIDPEFSFMGFKEFDVGVLIAHLKLAKINQSLIEETINDYSKDIAIDELLVWKVVGIEILRRIFGLAQLPLNLSIEEKKVLTEEARNYIISV